MRIAKFLPLVLAAGCVGHADVMIPHPLTGHSISIEATEVEKPQGLVETNNGLPIGALTERAKLTRLDDSQACFAVEMHSLSAEFANIRALDKVLKAQPSGDKVDTAMVSNARVGTRVYQGLVPHQEASGMEEYCAQRDPNTNACNSWRTRTLYTTTMVPGPVTVYEGSADLCFAHGGIVTKQSQRIILDLHKITMVGFMPQKTGIDFRWGFTGYSTDKPGKETAKAERAPVADTSDDDTDAKFDALMASKEKSAAKTDASKPAKPTRAARRARKPRPTES